MYPVRHFTFGWPHSTTLPGYSTGKRKAGMESPLPGGGRTRPGVRGAIREFKTNGYEVHWSSTDGLDGIRSKI